MNDVDDAAPTVSVSDETGEVDDPDRWADLARDTLLGEGVGLGHLDLHFVAPDSIAALNRDHLGHDGPTDVLAFPLDGPTAAGVGGAHRGPVAGDGPPLHLGDVVVCPEVASRQAAAHCGSYEPELTLLIVHGVLHVLGHDHAEREETVAMQARERHHLARLGLRHPVPE